MKKKKHIRERKIERKGRLSYTLAQREIESMIVKDQERERKKKEREKRKREKKEKEREKGE